MNRHIQTIIELTGCTEDDAMRVYAETNNVEDAVDKLLPPAKTRARPKIEKVYTPEQIQIKLLREEMKKFDDKKMIILTRQPGAVVPGEQSIPHEEMVLQNSCDQECQLPVLE